MIIFFIKLSGNLTTRFLYTAKKLVYATELWEIKSEVVLHIK